MKNNFFLRATSFVAILLFCFPFLAKAAAVNIENLKVEEKNDFVLEPGKAEIFLNPGETVTRSIMVTSRVPGTTVFSIGVEDIKGTRDPDQAVLILDGEKGPYSGKSFIKPATDKVSLKFGQRASIPITITIPSDTPPGDYDSVILAFNNPESGTTGPSAVAQGSTRVISRLGTLFFIRVNGQAREDGKLEDFRIKGPSKLFYEKGPITFQILYNNSGNVHLVPYGTVTIRNMAGQVVDQLPIDAYFSLPDSIRYREVTWQKEILLGRYTATVHLERGYGGLSDDMTIAFWVLPWKILMAIFAAIFVILLIIVIFFRTFEISRK